MQALPDVTSDADAESPAVLRWVGMEDIAVPVSLALEAAEVQTVIAHANVYVSLETPTAKGIHMSRLHAVINSLASTGCDRAGVEQLLDDMASSQGDIGNSAKIDLSFELLLQKPALLSAERGYQAYPVKINAEKGPDGFTCDLQVTVPYSSTCPCSASLARQLYAHAIDDAFPGEAIDKHALMEWVQSQAGSVATPHSQRSYAYVKLSLGDNEWPDLAALVFHLEALIGTPVQTAVKRSDEQEFARLNAQNLMFCEDAARRLKAGLEMMDDVKDYWFKVEHQESLHAHNAVVIDFKRNA